MENAAQQYAFALVNDQIKASRVDKWEAVGYYFPKSKPDPENRYYAGMASIQLARAWQRKGVTDAALKALASTIRDQKIDEFIRAHACIVKAIVLEEADRSANAEAIRKAVEEAIEFWRQEEGQQQDLEEQIDALVRASDAELTEQAWKVGRD